MCNTPFWEQTRVATTQEKHKMYIERILRVMSRSSKRSLTAGCKGERGKDTKNSPWNESLHLWGAFSINFIYCFSSPETER